VLPKLEISQSIRNDIRSAVNSGYVVMVPQRNVQYFDWVGVGYIVLDPSTGSAGYMISGGIAGGAMAVMETLGHYVTQVVMGLITKILFEVMQTILLAAFGVGKSENAISKAISFKAHGLSDSQMIAVAEKTGPAKFMYLDNTFAPIWLWPLRALFLTGGQQL